MQQPCYGGQPAGTSYTNGFAIAGFVLSFFFAILGLVFGIIGYKKSRLFMNSGKGLSIAAIAISIVSMALAVSLIIIATTKDYINPIYFKWY